MSYEDVTCLVDEKLAFKALCKEHFYKAPSIKDKDKLFRDNYIKSMIHKNEFSSNTLKLFKQNVMHLNLNRKPQDIDDENIQKAEMLKHNQNLRASEKRGTP